MGEAPETVFVTGCPSIDLAVATTKTRSLEFDPFAKYGGVGRHVDHTHGYLVVLQHPVTTEYDLARAHVVETLAAVQETGLPTFWFWPNVDAGSDGTSKGIRHFRETTTAQNIHFFKNMEPGDFLQLVYYSRCLVGNSSVGIRECAFLGVPVVNVGTRQEGRDRGRNVVDVGYDRAAIRGAIDRQAANGRYVSDPIYGTGDAGQRCADLLSTVPLAIGKRLTY
jgi:UDP-hydrolysing UDP-N-acetyl-D-glucosamine 2-epimerase